MALFENPVPSIIKSFPSHAGDINQNHDPFGSFKHRSFIFLNILLLTNFLPLSPHPYLPK